MKRSMDIHRGRVRARAARYLLAANALALVMVIIWCAVMAYRFHRGMDWEDHNLTSAWLLMTGTVLLGCSAAARSFNEDGLSHPLRGAPPLVRVPIAEAARAASTT